jgi:hypothetical protein
MCAETAKCCIWEDGGNLGLMSKVWVSEFVEQWRKEVAAEFSAIRVVKDGLRDFLQLHEM